MADWSKVKDKEKEKREKYEQLTKDKDFNVFQKEEIQYGFMDGLTSEQIELYAKLNAIPDSYFGFVMGIISYAKKKPERLDKVLQFLDEASNPASSDVVKFVMEQPDFHEYGLGLKEMAG